MSEIPAGWKSEPLGRLAEVVSGGTPSRYAPEFWSNGTIPWVTPTDITGSCGRFLTESRERITELGLQSSSAKKLPPGTLLMTSRATLGEVRIAHVEVCTNQGFKSLVPRKGVDGHFLYYQIGLNKERYKGFGIGSTFLEVNKRDTERFELLVAPESEQRRIAEILTTVDEAMEQTEALVGKLEQMKAGLMHDLFTRGVTPDGHLRPTRQEAPHLYHETPLGWLPKEWRYDTIGSITDSVVDGPFGSNLKTEHYVVEPGVRVVRLQNVDEGQYNDEERAFVSESHANFLMRNQVLPGDVLIAGLGEDNNVVGRACCYPDGLPPAINKADCFRLRCLPAQALNAFVMFFLNTAAARRQVRRFEQGVTRRRINTGNMKKIFVSLPSIAEQQPIVQRLADAGAQIEISTTHLAKLRQQKQGLMQDLLTGRVPV